MAEQWRQTTIGEQITLQRGFDITRADQREGVVPVVSSGGISSYHDTAMVVGPGVVLGRKGVVGSVYYIEPDYWPHDTTLWVKNFKGNDPRFVYYFFRQMAAQIAGMDVGSANPTLNRNHVHPIEALWPPVPEQRAISGVLGALDDKIEQNGRTSAALERLARTMFRAWFVNFEPVRAKAAGVISFPLISRSVFEGLPSRLVDSELGPVPEDWEITNFGSLINLEYGKALKAENRRPGKVRVFGSNGQVGWHDTALVEHAGIVVGRKGNPGTVEWAPGPFFPIDTTFYVASRTEIPRRVLFYLLQNAELSRLSADSAVPGLNRTAALGRKTVVPPEQTARAFDEPASELLALSESLAVESRKLAQLRDYLLPKLLSGVVRVRVADGRTA